MKRVFILLVMAMSVNALFAAGASAGKADSIAGIKDSTKAGKNRNVHVTIGIGDEHFSKKHKSDSTKRVSKAPGVSFGLTFSRFDIGFSKLIDNGSFTLSPNNEFLDYNSWKTSNVGFDLLQFGYRFNSNFKIYLSGGFDWTHIRLERDITMKRDWPVLAYDTSSIHFDKNRFSSTYLRIPLSFEFRTNDDNNGKKFRFVAGPDIGFLLNGRVKQKSDENGKQKFNDDYHFTKFRYGAFARIGYGYAGLYVKYYFNDMFENSPAQEGLRNMSFGLTLGF